MIYLFIINSKISCHGTATVERAYTSHVRFGGTLTFRCLLTPTPHRMQHPMALVLWDVIAYF